MNAISCTDETFDPNLTSEYKLSIQVGLDGFSFCILDETRKKFLVFKHFPFLLSNYSFLLRKVKEIADDEEILKNNFKSVAVGFVSTRFTLIPLKDEPVDEARILGLSFGLAPDEAVDSYQTGLAGVLALYAYPKNMKNFFSERFENIRFYHQLKPLFSAYAGKIAEGNQSALLLCGSRNFTLVVYDGQKIVFSNSFQYSTEQDFNFYLLQSFNTLGVEPAGTTVFLTGEINHDMPQFKFIKGRFKAAEFLKLSKGYQYSYTFSEFPQHAFISVINSEE